MDDLTDVQPESPGEMGVKDVVPFQTREIRKWQVIASMVDTNPDVLPFPISTNRPERLWAFFSQASGILQQTDITKMAEEADSAGASVIIF